jgi:hypothetical protein
MEAALVNQDAGIRSTTVSNLMFEHGPALDVTIPLLAKAMEDETRDVRRLAESALSRLGRNLSDEDAEAFEAKVHGSPNELATRILLLAYYFLGQRTSPNARKARHQHILWVIRNAPESHSAGTPDTLVLEREDSESYSDAKSFWLEQVQQNPTDAGILGNAANFFVLNDKELSERLYKKAKELEPENAEWSQRLGHLYSLEARGSDTESARHAKLALQELRASEEVRQQGAPRAPIEDSLGSSDEDTVKNMLARIHSLPDLAKAAIAAGELADARRFASELLSMTVSADLPKFFREDGNAIHYGNLVLGLCEMRSGDIQQAKEHLLASGQTKGSPTLCSFGPNMSLAKELLESGDRDTVLDFFELCGGFWKTHADELQQWAKQVKRGEIPEFGANLDY